jgi:elongation factor G
MLRREGAAPQGHTRPAFVPVLCGSAFKNKGVQPLLDAVVDYLPSPLDIEDVQGINPDTNEPDRARPPTTRRCRARVQDHERPVRRSLTFARIYSGTLTKGSYLNSVKDKKEKIGRMLLMHANRVKTSRKRSQATSWRSRASKPPPGHALRQQRADHPRADGIPEPVIELSVEPKTKADQEKMGIALNRLAAEDPRSACRPTMRPGQTIIKGMGELHLDILVDRMKREFKVEANVGAPQVAYRRSITKPVDIDYTHKKQSGGSGQFGRVKVSASLPANAARHHLHRRDQGRQHSARYIPSVERACVRSAENGHMIGFPIIDFEIKLTDGAYHDVDSSALAFEIAGRAAMREMAKAGIKRSSGDEGRSRYP